MSNSSVEEVVGYTKNRLEDVALESRIPYGDIYIILHLMLPEWKRARRFSQLWTQNISDLLDIETASVTPSVVVKDTTSLMEVDVFSEEEIMLAMVGGSDLSVQLPSVKELKFKARITNIQKGMPPVID